MMMRMVPRNQLRQLNEYDSYNTDVLIPLSLSTFPLFRASQVIQSRESTENRNRLPKRSQAAARKLERELQKGSTVLVTTCCPSGDVYFGSGVDVTVSNSELFWTQISHQKEKMLVDTRVVLIIRIIKGWNHNVHADLPTWCSG